VLTAYIDPGSGSLFVQALVGGLAASGVIARMYWSRVRKFLHLENRGRDGAAE
jgi:hypothetical protein